MTPAPSPRATLVGFSAILLWSLLASLAALTTGIPAFELLAISFAIGSIVGAMYLGATGGMRAFLAAPLGALGLGVAGLFGYHLCYFLALRTAPTLEANLINYLWPLLIVLFSALLPTGGGRRQGLRWWHVAGALLGLAGTVLIVGGAGAQDLGRGPLQGYLLALGAALIWSSYSVLARRYAHVPSGSVALFCLITAGLSLVAHVSLETTVWPLGVAEWAAILAMGLGPLGLAFYVWDHGIKHGDIRVLGAASYAAPLLSTLLLVALGIGEAGPRLWLACALITAGAALAARDLLFRRRM